MTTTDTAAHDVAEELERLNPWKDLGWPQKLKRAASLIRQLRDEIERKAEEDDRVSAQIHEQTKKLRERAATAEAEVSRLRERVEALEKALGPFSGMPIIDALPDAPNMTWISVPLGWLRAARTVSGGGDVDHG